MEFESKQIILKKQAEEIEELIEELKRNEKEFSANLMTQQVGYSYSQAYNQALSDTLLAIKQITIK